MPLNDFASPDEVAETLRTLSGADQARLRQIARIRASGMAWVDWQDLLHDAIDRVLDGSRNWPKTIPFVAFMREVMRSIASEQWRRKIHGPVVSEADFAAGAPDADMGAFPSEEPDPERAALARQCLDRIFELFASDADATAILIGLSQGASPAEIQRAAGLTETAYASAQKRIRRALNRAFPTKESWS